MGQMNLAASLRLMEVWFGNHTNITTHDYESRPLKRGVILRTQTPAIQTGSNPGQGPTILRVVEKVFGIFPKRRQASLPEHSIKVFI